MSRELGQRLHAARVAVGLNQTAVADDLGLTQTTISQYERGLIVPPPHRLARLAELYRVDAGELLKSAASRPEAVVDSGAGAAPVIEVKPARAGGAFDEVHDPPAGGFVRTGFEQLQGQLEEVLGVLRDVVEGQIHVGARVGNLEDRTQEQAEVLAEKMELLLRRSSQRTKQR